MSLGVPNRGVSCLSRAVERGIVSDLRRPRANVRTGQAAAGLPARKTLISTSGYPLKDRLNKISSGSAEDGESLLRASTLGVA